MQLQTQNLQPLEFSQGDVVTLNLVAVDDQGNPVDLTAAVFSTQILGANSVGPITFGNTQHTIVSAAAGQFSLALADTDTANCGLGQHKEIITNIVTASVSANFRGVNLLTVYPQVPVQ